MNQQSIGLDDLPCDRIFDDLSKKDEKVLLRALGVSCSLKEMVADCIEDITRSDDLAGAGITGANEKEFRAIRKELKAILRPRIAQAISTGIVIGRQLERSPELDAEYGSPFQPDGQ